MWYNKDMAQTVENRQENLDIIGSTEYVSIGKLDKLILAPIPRQSGPQI